MYNMSVLKHVSILMPLSIAEDIKTGAAAGILFLRIRSVSDGFLFNKKEKQSQFTPLDSEVNLMLMVKLKMVSIKS